MLAGEQKPVEVRRSLLILASARKMKVPEISRMYHISGEHIRKTIHRFNQEGMDSLKPNYGGGRPPTFTEEQRERIIDLAQIPPHTIGYPFRHWSLSKLKEAAEERKIVSSISIETIRVILDEAQDTFEATWQEYAAELDKLDKNVYEATITKAEQDRIAGKW